MHCTVDITKGCDHTVTLPEVGNSRIIRLSEHRLQDSGPGTCSLFNLSVYVIASGSYSCSE